MAAPGNSNPPSDCEVGAARTVVYIPIPYTTSWRRLEAEKVRSLPRTTSLSQWAPPPWAAWVGGERAARRSASGGTARGQPPRGVALRWEESCSRGNPSGQETYVTYTYKATNTTSGSVCASVGRDPPPPRAPPLCFVRDRHLRCGADGGLYPLFPTLPPGGASKPRSHSTVLVR